jgi:hypothetical protein
MRPRSGCLFVKEPFAQGAWHNQDKATIGLFELESA